MPGYVQQDETKQTEYQAATLGKRPRENVVNLLDYKKVIDLVGESLVLQDKEVKVE